MKHWPHIWVLADNRPGNRAQCLGIADRLGLPYEVKEMRYNSLSGLPNVVLGSSLAGLESYLAPPWPDLVIAAGRRSAPVARYVKRKSGKAARLVHCMWPEAGIKDFDCIVLPQHDREHAGAPNVLRVIGAPHRVTRNALDEAGEWWEPHFARLPRRRIALLVGGSTRQSQFDTGDYHRLGVLTASMSVMHGAGLLITTSRRTGVEGERTLMSHLLNIPHHLHSWQKPKQKENPYLGYLAQADAIIVTADSIAMCSEACTTGKPVYIFAPKALSPKHKRFMDTLLTGGYAKPLREDMIGEWKQAMLTKTLDGASDVAEYIHHHLLADKQKSA